MGFFEPSALSKPIKKSASLPRCGECGLSSKCYSPRMEPTGTGKQKILFVAEAPGEQEDRQGVHLIGEAGKFLRKTLKKIGQNLDDAWKTNCVICRPPKNEISNTYINACRPNLLKTIKRLKPNVIILLGGSAVRSLLSTEWKKDDNFSLGRWMGWNIPSLTYNAWICPTYHPSYIVRMGEDKTLTTWLKRHLKAAYRLEKKKPAAVDVEDLKKKIQIIKTSREARAYLRDLSRKKGILAFDYETTCLKPENNMKIVSCSFCLDGEETAAMMIDEDLHPYLSRVLQNPDLKKIASNAKFEERWTIQILGHGVEGWYWDTMIGAHLLDNRPKVTSVKFLSYIYFGVADYDSHITPYLVSDTNKSNRILQLDPDELLIYNGLDSLLEYMVHEVQKEKF